MVQQKVNLELYPKQAEFIHATEPWKAFVGGIGSGKSRAIATDLIMRAKPNRLYAVIAPTYKILKDATLRSFLEVANIFGLIGPDSMRWSDPPSCTLLTKAEVLFRSGDEPEHLRAMNLSGAVLEEASLMEEEVFQIIIGRLRQGGEDGWLCLGGEEKLFDPVARIHRRLDEIREDFHVYAINTKTWQRVIAKARKPFRKGIASLYRFHLSNGLSFVAPLQHKVLACEDYVCEHGGARLKDRIQFRGQSLPLTSREFHTNTEGCSNYIWLPLRQCVSSHPRCDAQAFHANGRQHEGYCSGKVSDFPSGCLTYSRLCDEQLSLVSNISQAIAPLLSGVRQHNRALWREDDLVGECICIPGPSSTLRLATNCALCQTIHAASCESHISCKPLKPASRFCQGESLFLGSSKSLSRTKPAFVRLASLCDSSEPLHILSYEYVREDWFYDLTVPIYGNYEHCRAFHHNTAGFTPKGKDHWTYKVFGMGDAKVKLVHARTRDNIFLPPNFELRLRETYTDSFAQQELEGLFMDTEGAMFKRKWFQIIDQMPSDVVRRIRSWDFAATPKKETNDPDWTVGSLLASTASGLIVIEDVQMLRGTPLQVEALVKQTAELDGKLVTIWGEQEPGSSGVFVIDNLMRGILAAYDFHGQRSTGKKPERARPLAARAERGQVKLLRAHWCDTALDQASSFPFGKKDDIIDSWSLGYSKITEKQIDIYKILDQLAEGGKPDAKLSPSDDLPVCDRGGVWYARQYEEWWVYVGPPFSEEGAAVGSERHWAFSSPVKEEAIYAASLLGLCATPDLTLEQRAKVEIMMKGRP